MKVAIYCRLSEEDKNKEFETEESLSIKNQKSILIKYAREHNWEIYNIYSDDDYTGADRNRPQFNRLIKDAKEHKFDIILCKTQSRFTRELELVEKYIHGLFPLWNIRFISVVDNADTDNKGNKKSRQINGLVNEWYLEDMSENIKSVLTDRRKNGYHIGSFAPYGYKKDHLIKGHLIIDNEASKIVKEIFILFNNGYGKTAIAKILNERGVPNPTEYKRLQGLKYKQAKNSTLWKYYSIADILTNEVYIGNLVQGKYGSISYKTKKNKPRPKSEWYIVKSTHEPIIDIQLWESVQKRIKKRSKPFANGKIGLFAKKAKCMYCGYTLRSSKTKEKHYLKCPTKCISKDKCIGSFISVDRLEQLVIDEFNYLCENFLDKDSLKNNIEIVKKFEKHDVYLEIKQYKQKIAEYSKAIKQLYLDKVKGIISEKDFIYISKDFESKRSNLEKLIKEKQDLINKNEGLNQIYKNDILEKYINIKKLNREMVEQIIDFIYIGKRISGSRQVPIEIHWKF